MARTNEIKEQVDGSPEMRILRRVLELREKTKCNKFVGGLTTELLRKEFIKLGLNVSNRDVFIEGVPSELDLLIAKTGRDPEENLVYRPSDVLSVFEIKFRGSYGKSSIDKTRNVFDSVKAVNKDIACFYISVSENRNYRHRVTRVSLGYDCFELLTRDTNLESALRRDEIRPTGDWQRLVSRLQK